MPKWSSRAWFRRECWAKHSYSLVNDANAKSAQLLSLASQGSASHSVLNGQMKRQHTSAKKFGARSTVHCALIVVGFQHESDARRFWDAMRHRLREFSLALHPDKTRLIEFGRIAAQNCKRRGRSKPETFRFLPRLHQLDSIFAIFGAVSGGKPLYFRVWQIESRL